MLVAPGGRGSRPGKRCRKSTSHRPGGRTAGGGGEQRVKGDGMGMVYCWVFHMGVSENSVPLNPMVLLIIIPIKWL